MGIETALLVGSLIASVGGGLYASNQQAKAERHNARVSEANAAAIKQKADYDEQRHRERVRQLISNQRALYGKSGVSTVGSPLLVLEDTAAQGELDALAIRYSGDVEASQHLNQAKQSRGQARRTRNAGYIKAGTSLLTGGGRAYQGTL